MKNKDITAVITSFRSENKILNCIKSLGRDLKIIVIENSNDKNLKTKLEEENSNLECILSEKNLGYAKGNNLGLSLVKTKYALIINPDAEVQRKALDNFFLAARENPNFAIIGPYIQETKNNISSEEIKKSSYPVKSVKGFAMFLNLKQFEDLGFFDENFFIYFEEIDLCKRLTNSNKEIYLSSSIIINHDGAQSHNKSVNAEMELSRNWHWMWSTFYYHKKYRGFIISFFIILPKLTSAIFKMFLYLAINQKEKRKIYFQRFSGIMNSLMGKKSWYRPKV